MTAKDLISYWLKGADDAMETAEDLFKLKRYHHALFFCHLALEKILKGLVFKKINEHAKPIHNLVELAEQAELNLTSPQKLDFKEINSWNIQARYDTIKFAFYKKATRAFTNIWFNKAQEYYLWLKKQF